MRAGVGVTVGFSLIVGGSTPSWAGMRRENVQIMREQIRADKGDRQGSRQNLKAANQEWRAAKASGNAEAIGTARANRFQAKMEHKYSKSLVTADKRVMGGLHGKPFQRPDGKWEKVAAPASKSTRQSIKSWIKGNKDEGIMGDRDYVKTDRGYVRESRQGLKAAKASGDKEAVAGARGQLRQDRLVLKRDKAILNVHKDGLKQAQGYRYIEKRSGGGLMGMAKDAMSGKPKPPRPDRPPKP